MPYHPICLENVMTYSRLKFLWRHFHRNHATDIDFLQEDEETEGDEEELVIAFTEQVEREQEQVGSQNEQHSVHKNTTDDKVNVWYEKIEPVLNHVRERSMKLIFTLGTVLALDEMMTCFMGRSHETHRIKNKPIKEGYNFLFYNTLWRCRIIYSRWQKCCQIKWKIRL